MKLLLTGDKIVACLLELEMGPCLICGYGGYRILVIRSNGGDKRRVTLCAQHFAEACAEHPEVRELEQFRLDPRNLRSAPTPALIHCPRCAGELDLGEHGSYKIILATGIICSYCHARLVIQHNIAREEI